MNSQTHSSPIPAETDSPISALGEIYLQAGILIFTALVYGATVRFDFVYDDHAQIVQNALVHSWRFVPLYFQGHVWAYLFPGAPGNYYRPLNVLWFRINDAFFGLHPAGWHALSILLHVLATFLAYRVARRLTGRPLVAAFAALVFGVHPMRHEVVAWVSGTTESLWSVLFFTAFLAYLWSRDSHRVRRMALSCAFYAAALLSKETAIMLPAVVFAHAWIYDSQSSSDELNSWTQRVQRALLPALAYVPFALAYLIVRVIVLHGFSHPVTDVSLSSLVLTLPSVAFFYLKQWLLPLHMSEFYDLSLQTNFDVVHVLLPALALVAIAVSVWLVRGKLGSREVDFGVVWMIVLLLPALDIAVFQAGHLVHDRYFYLPSFGASLILALAVAKLAHGIPIFGLPQKWLLATLVLIGLLAFGTATASRYWQADFTMFAHAYSVAPQNWWARNGYASESAKRGDYATAIPLLQQLLQEQPDGWLANFNYGRINYEVGIYPAAEKYLARAQQIDPSMPDSYLELGLLELRTGQLDLAEGNMRKAVALRPIEAGYYFALGAVLAQRGNCSDAQAQFRQTLNLQPDFPRAQEQIGKCVPTTGLNSALPLALPTDPPADRPGKHQFAKPVLAKKD